MHLLLALLLAQAPAAERPLSFADVRPGDDLVYDVGGGTVELRACASGPRAVTVALSARASDGQPRPATLFDGVLVEVPRQPLSPAPQLPTSQKETTESAAGRDFARCDVWRSTVMDGPISETHRCYARELILGGGLVKSETSWLSLHGDHGRYGARLVGVGSKPESCPAWPKAQLAGWYRELDPERGVVVEQQISAGSAWLRVRTRVFKPDPAGKVKIAGASYTSEPADEVSQAYLADVLIQRARALFAAPGAGPRQTLKLGRTQVQVSATRTSVPLRKFVEEQGLQWPAPESLADAPLLARIQPVTRTLSRHSADSAQPFWTGSGGLVEWGLGVRK